MLEINSLAPDFKLVDQNQKIHQLSDYLGKWLLIYFYPKDNTPGCTKEACGFRDVYKDLREKLQILGVSADSPNSHQKFAQKYQLNFPILSDVDKKVIHQYQALGLKKMFGREYQGILRISYLIDPKGKIVKSYDKVKPNLHPQQVIQDLKSLQSK